MCVCIYVHVHMHVHVYVYILWPRCTDKSLNWYMYMTLCVYMYISTSGTSLLLFLCLHQGTLLTVILSLPASCTVVPVHTWFFSLTFNFPYLHCSGPTLHQQYPVCTCTRTCMYIYTCISTCTMRYICTLYIYMYIAYVCMLYTCKYSWYRCKTHVHVYTCTYAWWKNNCCKVPFNANHAHEYYPHVLYRNNNALHHKQPMH